jgi:nucleoid DNA-binding protein
MKPISIKYIDHIISRIYDQYPYISRYEISLIVKTFFDTMRTILVSGSSISINSFIGKMSLIRFRRTIKNKIYNIVKAKVSTPKKIRYGKL